MRNEEFRGTGQVFRFTLGQYLKSPSTIVTMALLLVISLISLLSASMGMSNGFVETTDILRVHVLNETELPLEISDIRRANALLEDKQILFWNSREELMQSDGVAYRDVLVTVSQSDDAADPAPSVYAERDDQLYSELPDSDLQLAADAVAMAVSDAMCRSLEIDKRVADMLFAPVSTQVLSTEELLHPDLNGADDSLRYIVTLFYSILLMVLMNFSSSYIVSSVVEEKASKLVEMLMVSVRPLALILGKILASMCLVVMQLVVLICGFYLSAAVSSKLFGMETINALFSQTGLSELLSHLDISSILSIVVSILLSYMGFSLLAGLAGVRCSKSEDIGEANGTVVMTVMACYIVAISTSEVTGKGAIILSCIPLVNAFIAPTRYLIGEIHLSTLLAGFAVQIAVIAVLAQICRKVYGALLMRRGAKVKLSDVFSLLGSRGGKQA